MGQGLCLELLCLDKPTHVKHAEAQSTALVKRTTDELALVPVAGGATHTGLGAGIETDVLTELNATTNRSAKVKLLATKISEAVKNREIVRINWYVIQLRQINVLEEPGIAEPLRVTEVLIDAAYNMTTFAGYPLTACALAESATLFAVSFFVRSHAIKTQTIAIENATKMKQMLHGLKMLAISKENAELVLYCDAIAAILDVTPTVGGVRPEEGLLGAQTKTQQKWLPVARALINGNLVTATNAVVDNLLEEGRLKVIKQRFKERANVDAAFPVALALVASRMAFLHLQPEEAKARDRKLDVAAKYAQHLSASVDNLTELLRVSLGAAQHETAIFGRLGMWHVSAAACAMALSAVIAFGCTSDEASRWLTKGDARVTMEEVVDDLTIDSPAAASNSTTVPGGSPRKHDAADEDAEPNTLLQCFSALATFAPIGSPVAWVLRQCAVLGLQDIRRQHPGHSAWINDLFERVRTVDTHSGGHVRWALDEVGQRYTATRMTYWGQDWASMAARDEQKRLVAPFRDVRRRVLDRLAPEDATDTTKVSLGSGKHLRSAGHAIVSMLETSRYLAIMDEPVGPATGTPAPTAFETPASPSPSPNDFATPVEAVPADSNGNRRPSVSKQRKSRKPVSPPPNSPGNLLSASECYSELAVDPSHGHGASMVMVRGSRKSGKTTAAMVLERYVWKRYDATEMRGTFIPIHMKLSTLTPNVYDAVTDLTRKIHIGFTPELVKSLVPPESWFVPLFIIDDDVPDRPAALDLVLQHSCFEAFDSCRIICFSEAPRENLLANDRVVTCALEAYKAAELVWPLEDGAVYTIAPAHRRDLRLMVDERPDAGRSTIVLAAEAKDGEAARDQRFLCHHTSTGYTFDLVGCEKGKVVAAPDRCGPVSVLSSEAAKSKKRQQDFRNESAVSMAHTHYFLEKHPTCTGAYVVRVGRTEDKLVWDVTGSGGEGAPLLANDVDFDLNQAFFFDRAAASGTVALCTSSSIDRRPG
jgi:hypothetical protein